MGTIRPVLIAVVVSLSVGVCHAAGPEDPATLHAEIAMLRRQTERLRVEVQRLRAENDRLRAQLSGGGQAQPTTAPDSQAAAPAGGVVYKGRARPASWVDAQFGKFADKIALLDGRFYDVGRHRLLKRGIWKNKPAQSGELQWAIAGSYYRSARILQSLTETEALVEARMWGVGVPATNVIFHVAGLQPDGNVDGVVFADVPLLCVGKYRYQQARGALATVQSFRVYRPLTKARFREALASGMELVAYKAVKVKKRVRGIVGGDGFRPVIRTRVIEETKIVATPVP